jgi:hypothetical protein
MFLQFVSDVAATEDQSPERSPRNAKDLLEQTMNLSPGRGAIITRGHLTESDNRGNQTTEKTATPIGASERQEFSLGGADFSIAAPMGNSRDRFVGAVVGLCQ